MKAPDAIKKGLECIAYGRSDIECESCWTMLCSKQTATDALAYIRQLEHELKAYRWHEGEAEMDGE